MQTILLVIQAILTLALIIVILMQRTSTDGFGLGGGSGTSLMTGRGAANFMTRTTAVLATLFMLNSLLLAWMASNTSSESILDQIDDATIAPATTQEQPITEPEQPPIEPTVPLVE